MHLIVCFRFTTMDLSDVMGYWNTYLREKSLYDNHRRIQKKKDLRRVPFVRGNGRFVFDQGVYQGWIMNGVPHGEGVMDYKESTTYEGRFYQGERHGHGLFVDKEYSVEGQFLHDRPSGLVAVHRKGLRYSVDIDRGRCSFEEHCFMTSFEGVFSDVFFPLRGTLQCHDNIQLLGEFTFTDNVEVRCKGSFVSRHGRSVSGIFTFSLVNGREEMDQFSDFLDNSSSRA